MPSKFKTTFLKLNKFIGSDKPRMDDFNADNLLIDKEFKEQANKISNFSKHIEDSKNHITSEEREKWNNLQWKIGTYDGDGDYTQNVDIGFKPSLGFVFQKDEFLMSSVPVPGVPQTEQRAGVLTPLGCSLYCRILDNGFMVCNSDDVAEDWRVPKLNAEGQSYVYIMFR